MLAAGEEEQEEAISDHLPLPSQPSQLPRVLTLLSSALERIVARNDRLDATGIRRNSLEAFNGVRAPGISLGKYLERLYKYSECSPACFVVGFVYIDRLTHAHPGSLVTSLNVHRLVVTCVMVASKMLDDVHFDNAFYARIGGVSNGELNRLELELLFLLDFGVLVSSRVFEAYCHHLENQMPCIVVNDELNGIPIQQKNEKRQNSY